MKTNWLVRLLVVAILGAALAMLARADDDDGTPGPRGPQGVAGPQGATGSAGAQGQQGADASTAHLYGGLELGLGLYSGRNIGVGLFNTFYAAPRDWGNIPGVSLSFNVGHDYEAERVDRLEKLVAELRARK